MKLNEKGKALLESNGIEVVDNKISKGNIVKASHLLRASKIEVKAMVKVGVSVDQVKFFNSMDNLSKTFDLIEKLEEITGFDVSWEVDDGCFYVFDDDLNIDISELNKVIDKFVLDNSSKADVEIMEADVPEIQDGGLNLMSTAKLVQKLNKKTDKKEWALVSKKDNNKVLEWYGVQKPSEKRVEESEKRVQMFKHMSKGNSEAKMIYFNELLAEECAKVNKQVGEISYSHPDVGSILAHLEIILMGISEQNADEAIENSEKLVQKVKELVITKPYESNYNNIIEVDGYKFEMQLEEETEDSEEIGYVTVDSEEEAKELFDKIGKLGYVRTYYESDKGDGKWDVGLKTSTASKKENAFDKLKNYLDENGYDYDLDSGDKGESFELRFKKEEEAEKIIKKIDLKPWEAHTISDDEGYGIIVTA